MAATFPNIYAHRKVAETSAKGCDVCRKPSTSVLITPDKKDFFYVCAIHLKDRHYCTPKIDEEAVKAKKERELAEETAKLKKEYEEKQRKKKEKEAKKKDKDKDDDKDKDKKDEDKSEEKDDEGKDKTDKDTEAAPEEDEPRVFELRGPFYQERLQVKRKAEAAKRHRERASQPNYFPSVPSNLPGK